MGSQWCSRCACYFACYIGLNWHYIDKCRFTTLWVSQDLASGQSVVLRVSE
jgi:positive regulator of sigma E activity